MPTTVHHFTTTGTAYDQTQTDDTIRHGDVLVIASESVIGVLDHAWPIAVTEATGELHATTTRGAWVRAIASAGRFGRPDDKADLIAGYRIARTLADGYGWPLSTGALVLPLSALSALLLTDADQADPGTLRGDTVRILGATMPPPFEGITPLPDDEARARMRTMLDHFTGTDEQRAKLARRFRGGSMPDLWAGLDQSDQTHGHATRCELPPAHEGDCLTGGPAAPLPISQGDDYTDDEDQGDEDGTPATVRALIVPTEGPCRIVTAQSTQLDAMRAAIGGGWLEMIPCGVDCIAMIDEEGRLKGLAANPRAALLAHALGWPGDGHGPIAGPVVFVGSNPPAVVDLPAPIVTMASQVLAYGGWTVDGT